MQGVHGSVILEAIILKDGHIQVARVTGPQLLQKPAIDAVRQWVYKPYVLDGEAVEVETEVNVVFHLGER